MVSAASPITPQRSEPNSALSVVAERVLTKNAWRLLPLLAFASFVHYMDRTNIAFAALSMNRDLGLTAAEFGTAASIFYLGYVLVSVPSALAMYRFGARRWLVQFQRTCWWSSSRCSHLKCWCTRSMSSSAVNVRSGSTIARLPCSHRGSIGLSQGLFTGKRHTRIRTPPVRFTVRLCVLIHPCTAWLTCQVALSHTSTHTRLPSFANL